MKAQKPANFRGGRKQQRGMAMALTMLVMLSIMAMILLGILTNQQQGGGSGVMTMADNSVRAAATVDQSVTALNLAEAGVEDTILWLSAQNAPPSNTSEFAPSQSGFVLPLWNATTVNGPPPRSVVQYPDTAHTFSVTLYPNAGNTGSNQKAYLIESVGNVNGFTQVLHVYVQQTSFGHFSFFENGAGGGTWSDLSKYFDGPVHMNASPTPITLGWTDNTSPMFNYTGDDAYTTGSALAWNGNGQANAAPSTAADWASLSAGGPGSVHGNQNDIPMPTAGPSQLSAVLGSLPIAPTLTTGATVCPSGGIYIHGDVQQMTLSADPADSSAQIIELYQIDSGSGAKDYTKIEISPANNQTTLTTGIYTGSGAVTLNALQPLPSVGTTNGLIYCDGNIGGQGGTKTGGIRGKIADNEVNAGGVNLHSNDLTVAVASGKNINVDGPILVNTERQVQQNGTSQYEFRNPSGQTVTSAGNATPSGDIPIYVPESKDTGQFLSKAGSLGLVSTNLIITQSLYDVTGATAGSAFTSAELDAIVYTNGPYTSANGNQANVLNYDSLTADNQFGRAAGSILLMGGNVHDGPETMWPHLYENYEYDGRLSDTPPPYFPTTSNRYNVLSWQRVSTTLQ